EKKIERFFRKWLSVLPQPYPAADRKAGFRYRLSVLQAEVFLTQIWDRPRHGREFFEEVIRENIDLGRPETVQLIFARKMRRSTVAGGRCRTRIVTDGVIPSLHVYYKNTPLKQYHKTGGRGAGLRTETTINNSYDFGVGPSGQPAQVARDRLCGQPPHARARESQPRLPDRRTHIRSPAKPGYFRRGPAHCVSAPRACSRSSPCFCCSTASLKASATANCGHYLLRCSGWKKATSVRAA